MPKISLDEWFETVGLVTTPLGLASRAMTISAFIWPGLPSSTPVDFPSIDRRRVSHSLACLLLYPFRPEIIHSPSWTFLFGAIYRNSDLGVCWLRGQWFKRLPHGGSLSASSLCDRALCVFPCDESSTQTLKRHLGLRRTRNRVAVCCAYPPNRDQVLPDRGSSAGGNGMTVRPVRNRFR
jgi:hypothetical protein